MTVRWLGQPFLSEYRSSAGQAPRLERILAVGRTLLAVAAVGAIYADPTEPSRFATLAYALLGSYAAYSLTVLLTLDVALRRFPRLPRILHGIDILWASAITFFSEGPVSPFFLFFVFVLLAATYRWGFRETFGTAALIVVIFSVETLTAAFGPWKETWFGHITFDPTHIITRVTYLLLTGMLLGYLAEQDKGLRAEIAASADAARQPRVDLGVSGSVAAIARVIVRAFRPAGLAIVIHDQARARTLVWSWSRDRVEPVETIRSRHVSERQRETWLFAAPARTWHVPRVYGGASSPGVTVDAKTLAVRAVDVSLPARLFGGSRYASASGVDFGLPGEWHGRVLLFDPRGMPRGLPFFETVAEHITPVLSNVLFLRRLRLRAGAAERARVARELHDGAIQALIGIEMRTEALRRRAEREAPSAVDELTGIQEGLRHEVMALRELMQQLQPVDLDAPHQLPDVLTAVVERFRRDTGVAARFVADSVTSTLPLRTAHEVVRIVQEALANVRKHSQARNVLVRLAEHDSGFTLTIEDDGRGFPFEGRLSMDDLATQRVGPAVIKQRARMIGGELSIESTAGEGARLEIAFDA